MATALKIESIVAAMPTLKDDEIVLLISEASKISAERKENARIEAESKIMELASLAGISLTDLAAKLEKKQKSHLVVFRNPENKQQTWTRQGRQPTWLKKFLADGGDIETCRVK